MYRNIRLYFSQNRQYTCNIEIVTTIFSYNLFHRDQENSKEVCGTAVVRTVQHDDNK